MVDAPVRGRDVEGAADTPGEPGLVEEDAGVIDEPRHDLAVLVLVDDALLGAVVLPLLGAEGGRRLLDAAGVLLVDQMGAVAAAALHQFWRGAREHPLAAVAEDTGPVARQERDVERPRPLLLVVLEADPLVRVGRGLRHGLARYSARTGRPCTWPRRGPSLWSGRCGAEGLDPDDGPVEVPARHRGVDRAQERGVAVVEDPAVGTDEPVAVPRVG